MNNIPEITEENQLDAILNEYFVLIFKHSPVCPVSLTALREIEKLNSRNTDIPVYMINVISKKSLSIRLAEILNVKHESPQIIIIGDGQVKWHASHFKIKASTITDIIEEFNFNKK